VHRSQENAVLIRRTGFSFIGPGLVLAGVLVVWSCAESRAQGSTGGTIGKTGKSASGTQSARPEQPARTRKPAAGRRPASSGGGAGTVSAFDGQWTFVATGCGAGMRQGVISGARISIGDGGGHVSPNGAMRVSFTTMSGLSQTAVGRLSGNAGAGTYSRPNGCTGNWTATRP
jgi:hypothetical protein